MFDSRKKIVCASDLHLGRRSSYVRDPAAHSAKAAWERIVELAIREHAELLLLAGDLVDEKSRYFEAFGALETGIARLSGNGIHTVAIAGNHDHAILDGISRAVGRNTSIRFTLLASSDAGGWSMFDHVADGKSALRIVGRSFGSRIERQDPMKTFPHSIVAKDVPTIGMLHAEIDGGAEYAPTTLSALTRAGVAAWAIGHTHRPELLASGKAGPCIFNCGSPQAFDPGEPGPHGAWVVSVENGAVAAATLVPLSSSRYDHLSVDVADAATEEKIHAKVIERVQEHRARLAADDADSSRELMLRVLLEGAAPNPAACRAVASSIASEDAEIGYRNVRGEAGVMRIIGVDTALSPAIDVPALADSSGPLGAMARLIMRLESGGGDELRARLHAEMTEHRFDGDDHPPATDGDCGTLLARVGRELLAEAVARKDAER